MKSNPTLWIVHCPAGGGHRAAAEALAEHALTVGCRPRVIDALSFTPSWFAKSYVQTHLRSTHHAPWAYGFGYDRLNRRRPALDRLRQRVDGLVGQRLLEAVDQAQPDVVIGTHFFPLSVFGRARRRGRLSIPLVGLVTDYTAHAFWADPFVDRYCTTVPAAGDLAHHGIAAERIFTTGIPVRAEFARAPAPEAHALMATPFPNRVRVLATSGGFGIGPLETAIRSFVGLPHLELTVVCGADPERRRRVEEVARAHRVAAKVIGFERDMPARMAEADIVLGKPGGLTVSEALAAGRPLALMGTCPGQEAQNEQWLRTNGAAETVDPRWAGPQLEALRASGALAHMARAAKRIGAPHAARDVLARALETLVSSRGPALRAA